MTSFLNARLREPIPFRQDKLPWHEWTLTLRAGKKSQPIRNLAQPLPLPALSYEEHAYINDSKEEATQIIPKTDAPLSGFLELAKWRHDFPPPQNLVAEQLAAASAHQVVGKEKESLVWFPDSKKWESSGTHDCDWLLFDFLLDHDDRRAGLWLHAKAQLTLSDLFHVRYPMAAPTPPVLTAHDIPVSVSSRDLSDLHGDIPTCWQEPVKPFTTPRFKDWNGALRKMRIKPEPSKFTLVYHNPKFPIDPRPIVDDREIYRERMQQEGIRSVKRNSGELTSDVLGGARYKPIELIDHIDPFDDVDEIRAGSRYLKSFAPEEVPLFVQCDLKQAEQYPSAPDPQARHEADQEKFAHAAGSKCPHGVYDPHKDASYCSVCNPVIVSDGVIKKEKKFGGNKIGVSPSLTQGKTSPARAKELLANEDVYGHELPGLKYKAPRPSITWHGEDETRTESYGGGGYEDFFGGDADYINPDGSDNGDEDEDHFGDGADWIINPADSDITYLRELGEYGEVFRRYYGSSPDLELPELKRDLYLFETALSKDWKSDAERKEWQRRLTRMPFFIHGVCPTGTCINNRCAKSKLPWERGATHALNRLAEDKISQLKVGTYYILVIRQGQPYIKNLKAKTADKARAEFDRLIESEVKKARSAARRGKQSEKEAEKRIRDAYRVADLCRIDSEDWEQSGMQDVAAD
jgi:hypothetical protein